MRTDVANRSGCRLDSGYILYSTPVTCPLVNGRAFCFETAYVTYRRQHPIRFAAVRPARSNPNGDRARGLRDPDGRSCSPPERDRRVDDAHMPKGGGDVLRRRATKRTQAASATACATAAILAIVPLCAYSDPSHAAEEDRILFVSSYHPAFPTFFSQIEGIRSGLEEAGLDDGDFVLDVEFMDTKRFDPSSAVERFNDTLSAKLEHLPPYDVVIAADDNATRHLAENRERLFGEIPLVFLGVNDRALGRALAEVPAITGVLEAVSIGGTLDLMGHLDPDRTTLTVICDTTPSCRGDMNLFHEEVAERPWIDYRVLSLMDLTYGELLTELERAPQDENILLVSALRDHTGTALEFDDSLDAIHSVAGGPIFHLWEHGLGDGVLGGVIVSHGEQGRTAGRMVGQILTGISPVEIQLVGESPNLTVFDHNELARFGIDPQRLPETAIVLNQPVGEDFIVTREQLRLLLVIAVSLLVVVVAIVIYTVRLRSMRQQLLAANRQAVEANRAKSEFLATMSHELRTPLNAVIGFSQMMEQRVFGPLGSARYEGYVRDIGTSGQHLLSLINDLLDMSKIESGRRELSPEETDIADVVTAVIHLLQQSAATHGVTLTSTVPADLPILLCDRRALHQMLSNLLSNAIKFTPSGGRATVTARMYAGTGLIIDVIDTGVGIAPEEQQKVLEPFRQAAFTRQSAEPGTGLGLPLVKALIELHRGRLKLSSQQGAGTTVSLIFPPEAVMHPLRAAAPAA